MADEPADNDNNVTPERRTPMQIFIFKSEPRPELRAFGGDDGGSALPKKFGPWHSIGAIAPDQEPPHRLSRDVIEAAIKTQGFQLWRLRKKETPPA